MGAPTVPTGEPLIFDSHAHYDARQFDGDRASLLADLPQRGVCGVINMGADLKGCYDTVALAKEYPYFYGAVGIHPECARELPQDWEAQLEALSQQPKIVAIGEIGLDYYWLEDCPKERQKEVFQAQLALAKRLSLPVVIHDRDAHGDTMEFLRQHRPQGVVHCFSGSAEMAKELVALGMYIGLGGVVTFKNARHSVEVAKTLPLSRLLLETDAPYLAPVPFRGKRNDSSLIIYVAQKIAELRDMTPEAVLACARDNTKTLFCLEEKS